MGGTTNANQAHTCPFTPGSSRIASYATARLQQAGFASVRDDKG